MAEPPPQVVLCPYCGHTQRLPADRCDDCGGFFDPLSRRVSQQHMGPWFIRNSKQPFCPGCSYDMLMRQIERGKVGPNTIMRGPTTKQFWALARNVPGVAHHLGYCHACNARIPKDTSDCPQCHTHFLEARKRDKLGLDPDNPAVFEEARKAAGQAGMTAPESAAAAPAAAASTPRKRRRADSDGPTPQPAPRATIVSTTSMAREDVALASPAPAAAVARATIVAIEDPSGRSPLVRPAAADMDEVTWMTGDGDQQADEQPAEAEPRRAIWLWLLVGLNVVLLTAVVVYLLLFNDG